MILSQYLPMGDRKQFAASILLNILTFFITGALISSLWWFNKISLISEVLILHIKDGDKFIESGVPLRINSLDFYLMHLKTLGFDSIGIIFSCVFLFSLPYFIRGKLKYKALLINWIFIPLILFSFFIIVKRGRYLMPILPAIAIVSACGIQLINNRKLKNSIIILIISFGII